MKNKGQRRFFLQIYGVSRDLKRFVRGGDVWFNYLETIVNCLKQPNQMKSLTILKGVILGIVGIAVDSVTKIKETIVSLVQNLLPSQTPKEGTQRRPNASRLGSIF